MSLRILRICAHYHDRRGYSDLVGYMHDDGHCARWRPHSSSPFTTIHCIRKWAPKLNLLHAKQEDVQ